MDINIELHPDELRDFFIVHLNKIYAAKSHLVSSLGMLKTEAHFSDLKKGIQETAADVKKQLARMREIYALLETEASEESCNGLLGLVKDSFEDVKCRSGQPVLRDLSILFYLHHIESMEMASFQLLQMAAVKMRNEEIKRLVRENYEDAKADRTLLLLITTKYLSSA
jgi:ferritin-like metal-binding protein YciE